MTDMKISDGAVDVTQRWVWGNLVTPLNAMGWGPVEHIIHQALTYYAAHPEELPQEVQDAVMKTSFAPLPPACPYCKDTKKMASIGGPPQPCWRCT